MTDQKPTEEQQSEAQALREQLDAGLTRSWEDVYRIQTAAIARLEAERDQLRADWLAADQEACQARAERDAARDSPTCKHQAPRPAINASSIARIAGNIMSGIAANPGWSNQWPDERDAEEALRLARYIAKKAQEEGGDNG